MIHRRRMILAAGLIPLAAPFLGRGQSANAMRRIGYLSPTNLDSEVDRLIWSIYRDSLRRAGWEEGKNLRIERRYAAGDSGRLDDLAKELVRLDVELIIAALATATVAAKRATSTIPIVMIGVNSPVESGLVQSLAHPGGNITGTAAPGADTAAKSIQLLKETAPNLTRLAILFNPGSPMAQSFNAARIDAAVALHISVQFYPVSTPEELNVALKAIAADRSQMLLVNYDGAFSSRLREIADFALEHKILSMGVVSQFSTVGGALYYGANLREMVDRSISYVDRILRGAKPSDLPVEQPTNFDLIVNVKTMRAIGIPIPKTIRARATKLIE